MARAPLADRLFTVTLPTDSGDGWYFSVDGGRRYGPFPGRADAEAAREALFKRWNTAAHARQGWVWRSTAARWVVTLPRDAVRAPDVDRVNALNPCLAAIDRRKSM